MAVLDYFETFLWPDKGWHLQWRFEGLSNSATIEIERSSSPEGPWETIDQVGAKTVHYDDQDKPHRSRFTVLWYRLKVYDNQSLILTTDPSTNKHKADKVTAEIIRQYEIRLQGINSHPGYYSRYFACYKRAVDGTPCDCVDPVSGERNRDRCPLCLGTGYLESWSNPVVLRGRFLNGEDRNTRMGRLGETEDLKRQMWTSHYPLLEPGDVLVEKKTGRHWKVRQIQVSDPNGVVVSQRPTLDLMDHEYIENTLDFPDDY